MGLSVDWLPDGKFPSGAVARLCSGSPVFSFEDRILLTVISDSHNNGCCVPVNLLMQQLLACIHVLQ